MKTGRVTATLAALAAFLVAFGGADRNAVAGTWASAPSVQARLIAATTAVGSGPELSLALDIRLASGWKTYWRSPGDAGLPPRLDWSGSINLTGADLSYPAPRRYSLLGLETAGYENAVTFPLRAIVAQPGKAVNLRARLDLLVCSEVCVPVTLPLTLDLPAGPAEPGPDAALVTRAAASVPGDGTASGLTLRSLRAEGNALVAEVTSQTPLTAPDLFVETDPPLPFAAPATTVGEGGRTAAIRVPLAEGVTDPLPAPGQRVTLTLVDGARAAEFQAPIAAPQPAGGGLGIYLTALLGGLILNLMPCVLPVLSIKLLALAGMAGRPPREVRARFLATGAGILASFLVLAAGLIGVKAAGGAVGWGVQFQEPLFLAVMAAVMTVFALSLWDRVSIVLPDALAARLGGREGEGLAGAFGSGALATILATPCSAPFVGSAVGFALAGGPGTILGVFAALGLGLAAPWLAVAAWPRLAAAMPRPGCWMIVLRRLLGGLMALTAAWLVSVLAGVAGPVAGMVSGALAIALCAVLGWGRGRWRRPLAAALTAGMIAAPVFGAPPKSSQTAPGWVAYDETVLRAAVAAGRTVFVDATADWCLTCLANERLVLSRDPVASRLADPSVLAMRADWTRADETVSRFLARFGRFGVPFYVAYGPGAPEGQPLPELLTAETVTRALDAVRQK